MSYFLNKYVFLQRLAIRLLHGGKAPLLIDETRQLKIRKCSESMWKFTFYACAQIWVISILHQAPWAIHTKEYFIGWPNQKLGFSMKLYYMCQCGFYVYSIGALLIWETRRKDFPIMMSHHVITSVLIGYSYLTRCFRIGIVILALHDTSDVFMEAGKVCKYSEKEIGASLCFGCFAITWLFLRLIIFPFWMIKASSCYTVEPFIQANYYPRTLYYTFNIMLSTLLVFHIYWWKLICAMIMRQLHNQGIVGQDIRSGWITLLISFENMLLIYILIINKLFNK
ncbi:ASC1-like protein 3 [Platanthera zijinensis]|uniref:ASC1-like protein 3 n=1 Tax=Platanthera zijinensis TaxID=2320716 RepID=A0AAP0GDM4_9ASPA